MNVNGLIRGQQDPTLQSASSACGCSMPGASGGSAGLLASMAVVTALAFLVGRRRRVTALIVGSLGIVALGSEGCACGGHGTEGVTGCGTGCNQTCGPPNEQGLIGAYTSVAVATDGSIWVAGYNDADVTNAELYGDLVAGKYDDSKQKVQWVDVDGLPPAPEAPDCAPNAASTWRDGLTDPGPDVGLWTSIQLDVGGNPMISYYDATNQALKFASSQDGGATWASHTVMQAASSDIGRYSEAPCRRRKANHRLLGGRAGHGRMGALTSRVGHGQRRPTPGGDGLDLPGRDCRRPDALPRRVLRERASLRRLDDDLPITCIRVQARRLRCEHERHRKLASAMREHRYGRRLVKT